MAKSHREKLFEVYEVADVLANEGWINDWENAFVLNLLQWEADYTDKQKKVIDDIYDKACRSPY